jgi:1-phosphatidylinositol-4-phosphate 5-kinase
MMKTIPKREFDSLMANLEPWYHYVKTNPQSLITKFFGLHSVTYPDPSSGKKKDVYLCVMNNVFKDFNVGIRFDLKGSSHGRTDLKENETPYEEGRDKKVALKDNDFNKHFGTLQIYDDSLARHR